MADSSFHADLHRCPVIAGIRRMEQLEKAGSVGVRVAFFLSGTLFDLRNAVALAGKVGLTLLAHIDLLQGIGRDAAGMAFLASELHVDGIITTKSFLIKAARSAGLYTVQRLFLMDSDALRSGFRAAKAAKPDAVEILPGPVVPHLKNRLPPEARSFPLIAGGLIESTHDMDAILHSAVPVIAVSTSKESLWSHREVRTYETGARPNGTEDV